MTIPRKCGRGFTLIELLVVIAIIATLASISVPAIQSAQMRARMASSTSDARNVLLALTSYAAENGGLYPESSDSSNAAFRKLFPQHCDQEAMFHFQSDRLHCNPEAPDEGGDILAPGENHWAYVSGLTDSKKSNTPIIMDAFTDGIGSYDDDHAWSRLGQALVGTLDGSVQTRNLNADGVIPDYSSKGNLFEIPAIEGDELVEILNPERRQKSD
jgi:prepilin-type N-terminal cleavage/methylation domain-containing protein